MSQEPENKPAETSEVEEWRPILLRDPFVAGILSWLVPGLGHFYQGRFSKAVLFFVCIMGTFVYGLYLGEGRVVYASLRDNDKRLPYACQVCVGLPSLPALVQAQRVRSKKTPLFGGLMAPPALAGEIRDGQRIGTPDELDDWNKSNPRGFELGTVFTMIAGLLNVLVIYDACCGPANARPPSQPGQPGTEAVTKPPSP